MSLPFMSPLEGHGARTYATTWSWFLWHILRVLAQYPNYVSGIDKENLPQTVVERQAIFIGCNDGCMPPSHKAYARDRGPGEMTLPSSIPHSGWRCWWHDASGNSGFVQVEYADMSGGMTRSNPSVVMG